MEFLKGCNYRSTKKAYVNVNVNEIVNRELTSTNNTVGGDQQYRILIHAAAQTSDVDELSSIP